MPTKRNTELSAEVDAFLGAGLSGGVSNFGGCAGCCGACGGYLTDKSVSGSGWLEEITLLILKLTNPEKAKLYDYLRKSLNKSGGFVGGAGMIKGSGILQNVLKLILALTKGKRLQLYNWLDDYLAKQGENLSTGGAINCATSRMDREVCERVNKRIGENMRRPKIPADMETMPWISRVKAYQAKHGGSYKEAMRGASLEMRKGGAFLGSNADWAGENYNLASR